MLKEYPEVSILMAVYEPRMDWFEKQLKSLNSQDYPNLSLIVLDDCSPKTPFKEIEEMVKKHILNFPFKILRNEHNTGSTKAFERLVAEADTPFIAFCDQDDIWESFKISVCMETLLKERAIFVCSDVKVIDGEDNIIAESITDVNRRHSFENLSADGLVFKNFAIGCTVVMETKVAKDAMPFIDGMVHDHWLVLFAASTGKICVCPQKLIRYRIHGGNQTGVLSKIKSKDDYFKMRILPFKNQILQIEKRLDLKILPAAKEWAFAREDFFLKRTGAFKKLWKHRKLNLPVSLFEMATRFMPDFLYKILLRALQKGII